MARWTIFPGFAVALLLTSCVSSFDYRYTASQEQRLIAQVLAKAPEEPPVSPLRLSEAAKRVLDARIEKRWGDLEKLDQLRRFLFASNGMHLTYNGDRTKTAMQVWNTHSGNCLSLANLFVAVARYVGLNAGFETVQVRPTWDEQGSTMVRYQHIVATGKLIDGERYVVDFLPDFAVGDRKSTRITDRQAVALYYNNLGAESLIDGHPKAAVKELAEALHINGKLSDAWNNMGAALRRDGEKHLAEFAYQRAIHLDTDNYSALTNLAHFYRSEGKQEEAKYFFARIKSYRMRNPYYHYMVAHRLYEKGEYRKAISALNTAVSLKRDEPEFYEALAKSYAELGKVSETRRYLALARKYAHGHRPSLTQSANRRFGTTNQNTN